MTDRELMQQALEALELDAYGEPLRHESRQAITALRDRLAKPEQEPVTGNLLKDAYNAMVEKKTRSQKLREAGFTRRPKGLEKEKDEEEPVAWLFQHEETGLTECVDTQQVEWGFEKNNPRWQKIAPLYTTPPQRKWVGLTDEEIIDLIHPLVMADMADEATDYEIARAIEAALKDKNT